ncbi:CRISPR subtype I-C/DVULG-associated protein Cas8c/Csd1 [Candidatus Electronema aureum]
MIFQNLIAYYDRLDGTEDSGIPPWGFSREEIGFSIIVNRDGKMIGEPRDLRTKLAANKYEHFSSTVPYTNEVNVRTIAASTTPNFLTDKADYIFGMSDSTEKPVHRKSFAELVDKVAGQSDDPGLLAVKAFLAEWNPADSLDLPLWNEICGLYGKWVAFELEGERGFVHQRPAVRALWQNYLEQKEKDECKQGRSLVTNEIGTLQKQYAQFKFGSGASLVSFNANAYESYGKERGDNAPIHIIDEFKSSAALKYLFRSKTQRLSIGDVVTVFWTAQASPVELFMSQVFNPPQKADEGNNAQLAAFLEAARKGKNPQIPDYDGEVPFYILGFSLNKARLALRFYHSCSVDELKEKIGLHFKDLEMERSERDVEYPSVKQLLKETVRDHKDNPHELLSGALMRSILTGGKYPFSLYNSVLGRIRADQARKYNGKSIPNVNYLRAAILKAVLIRNYKREVPMSWDENEKRVPYLLGGLFAVMEKAQLDALGKISSTIRDRFYGAASATPKSVFPRLLRLAQHHISKAEYGHLSDRRIGQLIEKINELDGKNEFPAHLTLEEQGLFAIGYYQQRNLLWRKKEGEEK